MSTMSDDMRQGALVYHRHPKPGKLEIQATKPLGNQRDLALAYSPGVAVACEAIVDDPEQAAELTARQNLVGVVTNGTAVLGLGAIGPLAAKPVMEGKAVLFKKFAGIDCFDIELQGTDVPTLTTVIAALEPTFGGINLEDIKAPECFELEEKLKAQMNIPVFHDDQHGTAIIVGAAVTNALTIAEKPFSEVKIVASGAGAAALACLNLLVSLGARRENIWVCDLEGVVYKGRETLMDRWKAVYAQDTAARTLDEVIDNADIFLGLSAGGVLKPELLRKMAPKPLILALANPTPEIMPDVAQALRPDAMICTGRSDFPNQVNNVLCFPYIFRGALDVAATQINEEMKHAAVEAIARLAHEPPSDVVAQAYSGISKTFGADSLIPNPFDPRLILRIAPAVARAAMETGVARRPIVDFETYQEHLEQFVFRSGFIMKPIFTAAKKSPRRVIYAEGEDERTLRAAQIALEEKIAIPILVGRPAVIHARVERFGLNIRPGIDCEIINPQDDSRYREYVQLYLERAGRKGITPDLARTLVRTDTTVIAALAVIRGDADAMICGLEGRYHGHLGRIEEVLGRIEGITNYSAMSLTITKRGGHFIADTYVTPNPTAEELAAITLMCAEHVRRFGLEPKVALLSHSNFGSHNTESAQKMRRVLALLRERAPHLHVDGEMHGDIAVNPTSRERILLSSTLQGEANLLIMPNLDAANIAYQMIKGLADALPVGPILLGSPYSAHILTPSVTSRGLVNMTALAVAEAQAQATAVNRTTALAAVIPDLDPV